MKDYLINACAKTHVSDEKSPDSRLAKLEKTQFPYVNEYFSDKHNEEIGVFAQKLINLRLPVEENVKGRLPWLAGLFGIIATFFYYKGFGVSDQVEQIPIILRHIHDGYLVNDFFVNCSENAIARKYHAMFIAFVAKSKLDLTFIFYGLTLISNIAISVFTFFTARTWYKGKELPAIISSALVMSVYTFNLGEIGSIYKSMLLSSTLAAPIIFASIYFAFRERIFWSVFTSGLSSLFHPLLGLEVTGLILFTFIIRSWIIDSRYFSDKAIPMAASTIVLIIFVLISFIPQFSQSKIEDDLFIQIIAYFRHPHHYLPSQFGLSQYILAIAFIFTISYFFYQQKQFRLKFADDFFLFIAGSILVLCFIGYLFVELIPLRLVVISQPFRLLYIIKWLGLIIISGKITGRVTPDLLNYFSTAHPLTLSLNALKDFTSKQKAFEQPLLVKRLFNSLIFIAIIILAIFFKISVLSIFLLLVYLLLIIGVKKYYYFILFIPVTLITVFLTLGSLNTSVSSVGNDSLILHPTQMVSELGESGDSLALFVNTHTPVNSIFLTPPTWGQFRIMANRAIVVDFKAFPFTDTAIKEWHERIISCYGKVSKQGFSMIPELNANYSQLNDQKLIELSAKYDFSYAILFTQTQTRFDVIYTYGHYKLVKI